MKIVPIELNTRAIASVADLRHGGQCSLIGLG